VHCEVFPVCADAGAQDAATDVIVGGTAGAVTVTLAEPDLVVSCVLVAVTLTGLVAGTALGAV